MLDAALIAELIGFVAGMIFYIDGWSPSKPDLKFSKSKRYSAWATLLGGGAISPAIDHYIVDDTKFVFFLGYLLGAFLGWCFVLVTSLILYPVWKVCRFHTNSRAWMVLGEICYSLLEVICLGIGNNPQLQEELRNQLDSRGRFGSLATGSGIQSFDKYPNDLELQRLQLKGELVGKPFSEQTKIILAWIESENFSREAMSAGSELICSEHDIIFSDHVFAGSSSLKESASDQDRNEALVRGIFGDPEGEIK